MTDKRQKMRLAELACKLRAVGVPLEINRADDVSIHQLDGITENRAFDLNGGLGTGFIISLCIVSKVNKFAISRFSLQLPWRDSSFHWLDDPFEINSPWGVYRLPGTDALEFPREAVINHTARLSRMWSRGDFVKGLLLGVASESIPDSFHHGSEIPAFIIVEDQFEIRSSAAISFWTDRSAKFSVSSQNKVRRRLFEDADGEASTLRAGELELKKQSR
jgi:hypothetical protein